MTARTFVLVLALAQLVLAAGCTVEEKVTSRTQVMLTIDTSTDQLRGKIEQLRVRLHANLKGDDWEAGSRADFAASELTWPVELPVIPRGSPYIDRPWEVVVEALAKGRVIAETRAVTGFALNEQVVLTLRLAACEGERPVCASDDCHGPGCLVCRMGSCVETGKTPPSELPGWMVEDAAVPDERDAGGSDGSRGTRDGSTPRDANRGGDAEQGPSQRCEDDGQLRCTSPGMPERERCVDGAWARTEPCPADQVCDSDTPGACRALSAVCVGNAGKNVCDREIMQLCNDAGEAQMAMPCMSERHCALGAPAGKCAVCLPGEHRCEGAELQVCAKDGLSFEQVEACGSAALCNAGAGSCGMGCAAGAKTCVGDELRVCNADRTAFTRAETCSPGLCDATGQQCDTCVPQTSSCEGNAVRTCREDGQGFSTRACAAPTGICRGNGTCVECASNADCPTPSNPCVAAVCDVASGKCGTNPRPAGTACSAGTCDGEGGCGECRSGDTKECGSDTGECVAGVQTCTGGRWGACTGSTSSRPEVCNGRDDDCDGNIDDAASCSGMGVRTRCVRGSCVQCETSAQCGAGQGCNAGVCENLCGNRRTDSSEGERCDPTDPGSSTLTCTNDCQPRTLYRPCWQDPNEMIGPGDCALNTDICAGYGSGTGVTMCVPTAASPSGCPPIMGYRWLTSGLTGRECLISCTPGSRGQCPYPVTICVENPFMPSQGWCVR